jgi:hypothetical protein
VTLERIGAERDEVGALRKCVGEDGVQLTKTAVCTSGSTTTSGTQVVHTKRNKIHTP